MVDLLLTMPAFTAGIHLLVQHSLKRVWPAAHTSLVALRYQRPRL
jgi:hypothetical protein